MLETVSALKAPTVAMRFVSSVLASKYSEGDLGVLLSLVSSTSSACSFGASRSGMWCYQIKGLPPPRHHQKSRNISIADAADLVRDLTAWGSSSGCCPALKARGVAQAMPRHGRRHAVSFGPPCLHRRPPHHSPPDGSPVPRFLLAQRCRYLC